MFLRHSRGRWAGKPFDLLPWQREQIVREVFGWKRTSDDLRRYRTAYIEVPKKNGVLAPTA
jgi:phage terminase large subunit-like protein